MFDEYQQTVSPMNTFIQYEYLHTIHMMNTIMVIDLSFNDLIFVIIFLELQLDEL